MTERSWLSDTQWAAIEPLLPHLGGKPRVDDRRVISGILHRFREGLRWRAIPAEYGRDCQESCVRGHSEAAGGELWRSRRVHWTSCFRRAIPSRDGLFDELKKALAGRVLKAELDKHLDGEAAAGKANHRNGYSKKTVLT